MISVTFDQLQAGQFYQCEITESQDYDLVASIVGHGPVDTAQSDTATH